MRRFRPQHVEIVRLHWQGYTNRDIAQFLSCSESYVSQIVNCDEAQVMLKELREHSISSYDEVQDEIQLMAPHAAREKIRLMLEANNESVRNVACSDILNMAGHSPVKRLLVERGHGSDVEKKIADMTPEELRRELFKGFPEQDVPSDKRGPNGELPN